MADGSTSTNQQAAGAGRVAAVSARGPGLKALGERHLGTFLRFSIVGTIGFVIDATVLYLLHLGMGLGLYRARVGSFLVAASVNWLLNRVFTFRDARRDSHGRQWLSFVAVCSLGAIANYGAYALVIACGPESVLLPGFAVAAGSIAGLAFNYTLSRRFVFKPE